MCEDLRLASGRIRYFSTPRKHTPPGFRIQRFSSNKLWGACVRAAGARAHRATPISGLAAGRQVDTPRPPLSMCVSLPDLRAAASVGPARILVSQTQRKLSEGSGRARGRAAAAAGLTVPDWQARLATSCWSPAEAWALWAFPGEVAYCSRSRPTQVGKRTPLPPRPHGMCPASCKSLDILRRVGIRAPPSRSRTRILLSRTDHAQSSSHDSQRLGSPPPAKDPRTRKLR